MKNTVKKLGALLLAIVTVFSAVCMPVFAENDAANDALDALMSSVGYSQKTAESHRVNLDDVPSLEGVENPTETAYKIDSVAAYENFVSLVNEGKYNFAGKTVYLACDLDISSVADQRPIGYRDGDEMEENKYEETFASTFNGTFNGQGYTISGINNQSTLADATYSGFFGWVDGATIVDLVVSGVVNHARGAYTGQNNYVGTGGLIAAAKGNVTIDNVYVDIDVTGERQVAGIVGRNDQPVTVTNTTNAGNIKGAAAGGFFGFAATLTIENCLNTGAIQGTHATAGFVSRARSATTINNCVNKGGISGTNNVGGILGTVELAATATVSNCVNNCFIDPMGGKVNIFGFAVGDKATLNNSQNNVDIPYIGYSADGFNKVDLAAVSDINDVDLLEKATNEETNKEYLVNTVVKITNAAGLIKLSETVNAGNTLSHLTVYLANDIDMAGQSMDPIGYYYAAEGVKSIEKPFSGRFDGQGYSIKNLKISIDADDKISGIGLFGLTTAATIRNLVIDDSCFFEETFSNAYSGLGAVAGVAQTSTAIYNIANYANVNSQSHSAGAVGRGTVSMIKYFSNYGNMNANNSAGGITGFKVGVSNTISNCENYGLIKGSTAGGIFSRIGTDKSFSDLVNYGAVLGSANAGGIVGRTEKALTSNAANVLLNNCKNYGSVGGMNDATIVSGIYTVMEGCKDDITMVNCESNSVAGYSADLVKDVNLPAYNIKDYDNLSNQKAYVITDAAGLEKLAALVNGGNNLDGVTVYLANDINMFGSTAFAPIGTATNAFSGIFDGNGNAIRGLTVNIDSSVAGNAIFVGLFGNAKNARIQNFILDATCSITQTKGDADELCSAGGILANGENVIVYNVKNQANVKGALHGAGIAGRGRVTAIHCENTGTIQGGNSAGGIFAFAALDIIDSVNYGNVSAVGASKAGKAGGLEGRQNEAGVLYLNSYNYGVITAGNLTVDGVLQKGIAGGVLGAVRANCTVYNCANFGVAGPLVTHDIYASNRYVAENGYYPTISGNGIQDLSSVGYSAAIAAASRVDTDALIACGLAKNIEDYKHPENIYHLVIDSAADMRIFAQLINQGTRGSGRTFYLANDIDMSGYYFTGDAALKAENAITPIGWDQIKKDGGMDTTNTVSGKDMGFAGTFDGQGYTISNLQMTSFAQANNYLGLFGFLMPNSIVKNVILDSNTVMHTNSGGFSFKMGGLAGGATNATVSNVWVQGRVSGIGQQSAGMIGRPSNVKFYNCTNSANVTAAGRTGGFGGFASSMQLYNCRNSGNISGGNTAGFVAIDRGTGLFVSCVNTGNVTGTTAEVGFVLGAMDRAYNTTYANCFNYGKVTNNAGATDKIVGSVTNGTFTMLSNISMPNNAHTDDYHMSQMLETKYQIKDNGNGTFDLRLVASVDSLNYKRAGFIINIPTLGGSATVTTNTVYTSIVGSDGNREVTYAAGDEFADTSKYFITYTIKNVADSYKDQLGTDAFSFQAFLVSGDASVIGYKVIEEINVAKKLTAKITTSIGTVKNFTVPQVYKIGNTNVTINLQYQAWPSVTVDENGVIYVAVSGRLQHIDPFGHTLLYISKDNGTTWSAPRIINDTPLDDRDAGITYMGNGRLMVTFFRIAAQNLLYPTQSFTTSDGKEVVGRCTAENRNEGYASWQKQCTPAQVQAVIDYWSTLTYAEVTNAGSWQLLSDDYGATWSAPIAAPTSAPHGAIMLESGAMMYAGGTGGGVDTFLSYDFGKSWIRQSTAFTYKDMQVEYPQYTYNEVSVVELSNGRILLAARANVPDEYAENNPGVDTTNRILTCYSDDEGYTWSHPEIAVATGSGFTTVRSATDNSICGVPPHLIQLDNGVVVMTYASRLNNNTRGEYAALSYDGGMTWTQEVTLCKWQGGGTDIGYPATTVLADGSLLTVYYQAYGNNSYCSTLYTKWTLS